MRNLINKVFGYFDLGSEIRTKYDRGQAGRGGNNTIHYFLQYLALVMGIFVQPFLEKFLSLIHILTLPTSDLV